MLGVMNCGTGGLGVIFFWGGGRGRCSNGELPYYILEGAGAPDVLLGN